MKIGIDTFSFHIALAAGEYDIFRTLDWLEDQGFAGLQININGPDDKFLGADHSDTDHLKRVRSAIEQKGFFVEIGGRRTSPEMLRWQLQLCADLGADTLRTLVVLKDDLTSTFAQTKRDMDAILPFAESLNVKIALENHEDITASELRQFLDTIPHSYLGACVDTGNDLIVYGDPLEAAQQLAPRAALLHVLVDQRSVATRPPKPASLRLHGQKPTDLRLLTAPHVDQVGPLGSICRKYFPAPYTAPRHVFLHRFSWCFPDRNPTRPGLPNHRKPPHQPTPERVVHESSANRPPQDQPQPRSPGPQGNLTT